MKSNSPPPPRSPREILSLRENVPAAPLPLDALVFDLGHVLYDPTPWQRWLLQLLARVGLHTHYQAFFRVFECDYLTPVYCGERDYWEALRDYLLAVGLPRGRIEEVLAAGHGRYRELWDDVRPLPGVAATLAQLNARGTRLAVLANSGATSEQLVEKLAKLGVVQHFDMVQSSRDLRCAKPASDAYHAVLSAMQVAPEQAGFVGHDALELAGAGVVGMTTFALNYADDAPADVYLQRIDQLLQVVSPPGANRRVG